MPQQLRVFTLTCHSSHPGDCADQFCHPSATAGVGNGYLAGSKDARFMDCNYTAEQ
jgi:hypothetical protein